MVHKRKYTVRIIYTGRGVISRYPKDRIVYARSKDEARRSVKMKLRKNYAIWDIYPKRIQ